MSEELTMSMVAPDVSVVEETMKNKKRQISFSKIRETISKNDSKRQKPKGLLGEQKTITSKLQFKSPAEFFANNKNIAGFDNVSYNFSKTV